MPRSPPSAPPRWMRSRSASSTPSPTPSTSSASAPASAPSCPGQFVSLSSEVLPQIREYERTSTTVVNAYVGPPVKFYLARHDRATCRGRRGRAAARHAVLGGMLSAEAALDRPAQIVECGPAAGVIGARHLGAQLGYGNIITFDMGGTTAKASLIERGRPEHIGAVRGRRRHVGDEPADGRCRLCPQAAGDRCLRGRRRRRQHRAHRPAAAPSRSGPQSAGAVPGPACYGRGGRRADRHRRQCRAWAISTRRRWRAAACRSIAEPARRAVGDRIAAPLGRDLVETAYGIHLVANANMMRAVKAVTTYRGRDPRDFVLFAFGGYGGVHAAVARPRAAHRPHRRAAGRRRVQRARPAVRRHRAQ